MWRVFSAPSDTIRPAIIHHTCCGYQRLGGEVRGEVENWGKKRKMSRRRPRVIKGSVFDSRNV